jgi:hypothetical protein
MTKEDFLNQVRALVNDGYAAIDNFAKNLDDTTNIEQCFQQLQKLSEQFVNSIK